MPSVLPARPMPTGTPPWKPPARMRPVGDRDGAGGGDHQAKRELGRRVRGARCAGRVADQSRPDACKPRRPAMAFEAPVMPIMRSLGRRRIKAFGKGRALAHCQEDVEIRQRHGRLRPPSRKRQRRTRARRERQVWTSRRCSAPRLANHRGLQFSPWSLPMRSPGPRKQPLPVALRVGQGS